MNNLNNNVIQIDDDQHASSNNIKSTSVKPHNFSLQSFPRLHSLIQRHQDRKSQEKPEQGHSKFPEVLPNIQRQKEVMDVIHSLPSNMPQIGEANVVRLNNREQPSACMDQAPKEGLLIVEESIDPIVRIASSQNEKERNQIRVQSLNKEMMQQVNNLNEPALQVCDQLIINNRCQPEFTPQDNIPSEQKPQLISLNEEQNQPNPTKNIETMHIQGQTNLQTVNMLNSNINQENKQSEACNQNANPNEQIQHDQNLNDLQQFDIQAIKLQILGILPNLQAQLESLNNQEIIEIYQTIKPQIDSNYVEQTHKIVQPQSQKQPINIPEQQNNLNINTVEHQLQIKKKAPIEINLDEDVQPQLPKEISSDLLHPFYALRNCNEMDLRTQMLKYFPQAKESLISMSFQQLKNLLNEALAQIEKQTRPMSQPSKPEPQKKPIVESMEQEQKQLSIDYMKEYLVQTFLESKSKILEIQEQYIKQIYALCKNGQESNEQILKKIQDYESKQEGKSILQMCIQKFPQLTNELKKLNEEQLRTIYRQLKNSVNLHKSKPEKKAQTNKSVSQNYQKAVISHPVDSPQQRSLKRNHQTMLSSNPQKTTENRQGKKAKKLATASDLRAKLISKLPNLKQNIMQLDDNQIEKIYKQCLNTANQKQGKKITNSEDEEKPVILIQDKPTVYEINNEKGKTKVYKLRQQPKKMKSKTIVLMHTEDMEEQDVESGTYRQRMSNQGHEKKWNCQCLQHVTISDLLKKLIELVDKKSK